jgi:hypothetical protein
MPVSQSVTVTKNSPKKKKNDIKSGMNTERSKWTVHNGGTKKKFKNIQKSIELNENSIDALRTEISIVNHVINPSPDFDLNTDQPSFLEGLGPMPTDDSLFQPVDQTPREIKSIEKWQIEK